MTGMVAQLLEHRTDNREVLLRMTLEVPRDNFVYPTLPVSF